MNAPPIASITIPKIDASFTLTLPPDIMALRNKALDLHREPPPAIVEFPQIDAESWSAHTDEEDWLIWRARRCAERLKKMPLDMEPGERIVGKPLLRCATAEEEAEQQKAFEMLAQMPPFPGGDAGHFHPDYEKLFRVGVEGILDEIVKRLQRPGLTEEQRNSYAACRIAMEGFSEYIRRVAAECEGMAITKVPRADRWSKLGGICRKVAGEPPTAFHEALQLMFLAQIALWFGEDHGLTSPGRMDQTLWPFYEADLAAGRIAPREAFALICCLYIQMNRILWPGSAVAVMVGGRDRHGNNITNDLTYLCLAARQATQLVYPTVGLAWHAGTPAELTDFAARMLATGAGDPAFFNDELISQGLRDHGVSEEDSFNYMNSTCVEIKVCGASNMWVTAPYFNCPKGLLDVMERVASHGAPAPHSFGELQQRIRDELANTIRDAARNLDQVWHDRATRGCFPLASCVISDCLERGQDFDRGGARYNWVENSFVGLANLVDSLMAVKHMVYDAEEMSLPEFHRILRSNFEEREELRLRILNTLPKYGNDDGEPDALAREWAEFLMESTETNTVGLHSYVPGFFCWIMHERMGSVTGATPDGRLAGLALADGAGAAQGREVCGPTASVLSTTKWSHRKVLGGLVHNAKFTKSLLRSAKARQSLCNVIETYLRRGGFEMQINVVGKEALLDAQLHPDQYPDLLVRVAGYSDYFVHLNKNMQDEVIARTEHEL